MPRLSIADLRRLIRNLGYVVTSHAADELEDDNLTILDLEKIVLSGRIFEWQRDPTTREIKCVVRGTTLDGSAAEVVAKIGHTGRLVIVTVYLV